MRKIKLVGGVTALLLVTSVFAQNPSDEVVQIDGAGENEKLFDNDLPEPKNLEEMGMHAEAYVSEIRDMLRNGLRQRSESMKANAKDIILKRCMDQRLNSLKLLKTMSEDELHRMRESVEFKAEESGKKSYSKIAKLRERATRSVANMRRCVGETASYTGGATLDVRNNGDQRNSTMDYYERDGSVNPDNGYNSGRYTGGPDSIGGGGNEFARPQPASRTQ